MRILIIDDDSDLRQIAAAFLARQGGVMVLEADSGPAGIALAVRERPDAILLDSLMPGMDGSATLEGLRRDPTTSAIPVVFLTATTSRTDLDRLTRLGARGILAKPFIPASFAADVLRLLCPEESGSGHAASR